MGDHTTTVKKKPVAPSKKTLKKNKKVNKELTKTLSKDAKQRSKRHDKGQSTPAPSTIKQMSQRKSPPPRPTTSGTGGIQLGNLANDVSKTASKAKPTIDPKVQKEIDKAKQQNQQLEKLGPNGTLKEHKNITKEKKGLFGWAKDKIHKKKEEHHQALDDYYNHHEDYKKMSKWERFKWAIRNPLAWLRAGKKKDGTFKDNYKGTLKRNAKAEDIEKRGEEYFNSLMESGQSLEDILGDAFYEVPEEEGEQGGEESTGDKVKDVIDKIGKGGDVISKVVDKLGGGDSVPGKMLGQVNPIAETLDSFSEVKDKYDERKQAIARGDRIGKTSSTIGMVEKGSKSLSKVMGFGGDTLNPIANGAEMVGNFAHTVDSAYKVHQYNKVAKHTGNFINTYKVTDKSTAEDRKMTRTGEMFHDEAKTRKTEAGFETAEGVFDTLGNAAGFGGPIGEGIGKGLNLGGKIIGQVKKEVVGQKRENTQTGVLSQGMNKEKLVNDYYIKHAHEGVTRKEAEQVVLKGLRFQSGKQEEAFMNMVANRSKTITEQANNGDQKAKDLLSMLQIDPVNGQYDRQLVAERMGAPTDGRSVNKVITDLRQPRQNPFRQHVKPETGSGTMASNLASSASKQAPKPQPSGGLASNMQSFASKQAPAPKPAPKTAPKPAPKPAPTTSRGSLPKPPTSGRGQLPTPPTSGRGKLPTPPTSGRGKLPAPPTTGRGSLPKPPVSGRGPLPKRPTE
jgi:hypothetical protein